MLRTAAVVARNSGAFSSADELDIIREGLFPFFPVAMEESMNQLRPLPDP
jgi:hypothetical protein